MINADHVWTITGQRVAMVPEALKWDADLPFRAADHGEAATPVVITDTICTVHEETSFYWRAISVERLVQAQHAIDARCTDPCFCRCHEPAS